MKYGEIVELGRHRLMCGDATKPEDVAALVGNARVDLVLTDPPYGIHIQNKDGTYGGASRVPSGGYYPSPIYPQMINDDNVQCARDHYEIVKTLCDRLIMWGANNFCDVLPPSNGWLIWDKGIRLKNSFGHAELAWSNVVGAVRIYPFLWSGCFRKGNYTLNPRPRIHICQKPVELIVDIMKDFSSEGDTILDCFGGSGTTLIACEVSNRSCLMMELSPDYCDIIVNRYKTLTQGILDFRS